MILSFNGIMGVRMHAYRSGGDEGGAVSRHTPASFRKNLLITSELFRTIYMAQFEEKKEMMPEDQYIQVQKQILRMPLDQIKTLVEEFKPVCMCPQCPTHNDCAKDVKELLFCSTGRSFHCITENNGCLCPGCPVAKQMGLKYISFCLMGNEKAQRFDAALTM